MQTVSRTNLDFTVTMQSFCQAMVNELHSHSLLTSLTEIDHACYRVGTIERYEKLRLYLLEHGTLLSEALINGRPIGTFHLHTPVVVQDKNGNPWPISLVELPAPKPGRMYDEGFEHIEAVTRSRLEDFMDSHRALTFDSSNLRAPNNRDISLPLPTGLVKFHEASLALVISEEKRALAQRRVTPVVLMDFDDTLIHSKEPFLQAMTLALSKHLAQPISPEIVRERAKPTFPEFFAAFNVTDPEASAQLLTAFQRAWPEVAEGCKVPSGVISMLSCLQSEGVDIVVWTARDEETTRTCLEQFGLSSFISAIHGYRPSTHSKPVPSAGLLQLCDNRPTVVVGDSDSDCRGAVALGCPFIQATWVHEKPISPSASGTGRKASTPHTALVLALKALV